MKIAYQTMACTMCCSFWFVVSIGLAIGLGVPLARPNENGETKVDMSGYGRCENGIIYVDQASVWTQYPSKLSMKNITHSFNDLSDTLNEFKNKNSIVWSNENKRVELFHVARILDRRIYTTAMTMNGPCHFTIDGIDWPFWVGCVLFDAVLDATSSDDCTVDAGG